MAASAKLQSALVRLGHLCFDDFLLLEPETLDIGHSTRDMVSDWRIATSNSPHIQIHLRRQAAALASGFCNLASGFAPSLENVVAAQQRLVTHFAYELLQAKAPPLYDALPWHDWDFSVIVRRFPVWKTRFLLTGDGTAVTMCRCRKSAGVYVLEPGETMARYIERKAEIEKVRRFRLLSHKPQAAGSKLSGIPLPDNSVDLAVIGSVPSLETGRWKPVAQELRRVSTNVLIIENNPLAPPLDDKILSASGFRLASVEVRGLGQRRCWWLSARP
jgi:hypothetical protein